MKCIVYLVVMHPFNAILTSGTINHSLNYGVFTTALRV